MSLRIKRIFIKTVACLVMATLLQTEVVFSSEAPVENENEYDLLKTKVTVRYQDEFGTDLLPFYVASVNLPGALYIIERQSEPLPDYDFIKTIGNAVGFHGEEHKEVIFVYQRRRTLITDEREVELETEAEQVELKGEDSESNEALETESGDLIEDEVVDHDVPLDERPHIEAGLEEVEEIQPEPTLTMVGTFSYDWFIVGAIISKCVQMFKVQ